MVLFVSNCRKAAIGYWTFLSVIVENLLRYFNKYFFLVKCYSSVFCCAQPSRNFSNFFCPGIVTAKGLDSVATRKQTKIFQRSHY